jgi:hypothetical protein
LGNDGAQWKRDDAASAASGNQTLRALWLDADGKRGWAVGGGVTEVGGVLHDNGVVLHYDGTEWKRDEAASAAIGNNSALYALWLDADGGRGWAVGSVVLHYDSAQWKRDEAASAAIGNNYSGLYALWLDADGKRGWAVGDEVMALHIP